MEFGNQPSLPSMPSEDLLPMLKDSMLPDRGSKDSKDIYCEKSDDTTEKLDSRHAIKSADTKASSLGLLEGEYCGLAKQLSVEYVDIFEILRAELLAAETREFELIENELLHYDTSRLESKNNDGNANGAPSTKGDFGPERGNCRPSQSPLMKAQFPEEGGQAQAHLALSSSADFRGSEETPPSERVEDPDQINDKDIGPQNAKSKCCGDSEATCLDDDKVDILQSPEVKCNMAQETMPAEDYDDAEKACKDISLNVPFVEAIRDAHPNVANDDGSGNTNVGAIDPDDSEDENQILQIDKRYEYSENEENGPIPVSGPITFSGFLSYSGILSQLPYSGSLSLHSDSSTSTRSFAFPVLGSDWTSSPAKIGPPDSRYFRRRRRWRSCFCCRRPTTLFD